MKNFIEVTLRNNEKLLLGVSHIISISPCSAVKAQIQHNLFPNYPASHCSIEYYQSEDEGTVPLYVQETYDQIKALLL